MNCPHATDRMDPETGYVDSGVCPACQWADEQRDDDNLLRCEDCGEELQPADVGGYLIPLCAECRRSDEWRRRNEAD